MAANALIEINFYADTHLAVVDCAAVATPLAFDTHRMRPALGKAARIKGEDPLGFPQPIDDLADEHRDQQPIIPKCRADKRLHDQALDIDQGGHLLGMLVAHMGQETCQAAVDMALAGCGLESVLIGHDAIAQTATL